MYKIIRLECGYNWIYLCVCDSVMEICTQFAIYAMHGKCGAHFPHVPTFFISAWRRTFHLSSSGVISGYIVYNDHNNNHNDELCSTHSLK